MHCNQTGKFNELSADAGAVISCVVFLQPYFELFMKNILVLFPKDWDRDELDHPRYAGRYCFFYEGFDLFTFPENVRLMTFSAHRYANKLIKKYRGSFNVMKVFYLLLPCFFFRLGIALL